MRPLVLLWGCLVLPGYGAIVGPKKIRGFEGDTVSLQCTYEEKLSIFKKYWCRKTGIIVSRCSGIIYAGQDGQERTEGRVSIQDILWKRTLNVTLRKLTLQDSGEYWCGVNRLGFDESFLVSLLVLPGTSRPSTNLDSTSAEDASLVLRSSSSKARVSPTMVRILAPVLVLLTLLLATGLAAIGRYMLQWRKEAQLATETQTDQKVNLSHLPLGNSLVPEYTVINLAAPTGPLASPKPSASPCTDIRCQSQTAEEEEASFQVLEAEASPGPPLHTSEEELGPSMFVPV